MNNSEKQNRQNQKYNKMMKWVRRTPPDRNTTRQSKAQQKKKKKEIEQFKSETQKEMQVKAEK